MKQDLARESRAVRTSSRRFKALSNRVAAILVTAALFAAIPGQRSFAQEATAQNLASPFQISNPGNKRWAREEAARVYDSACDLVARTVRPERPPRLHPTFILVLGAKDDEVVRTGPVAEVHLKEWNVNRFAEAVVILAAREVLRADDLNTIARQSIVSARSTVSLGELKENR